MTDVTHPVSIAGAPAGRLKSGWRQDDKHEMPVPEAIAVSASLPGWVWLGASVMGACIVALIGLVLQLQRRLAATPAPQPDFEPSTVLLDNAEFERQLDEAVIRCDRHGGTLCLLAISLDNLDSVNDGYGHAQSDELIAEATQRLQQVSGPSAHLVRMGGVEFMLQLSGDLAAACELAGRLCAAVAQPLVLRHGASTVLHCSIGVAAYPQHASRQRLAAHASSAMRQVKLAGGAHYMVFDPKLVQDPREQADLLADLRQAVAEQQLELYFQPKVDARSLQITAAEALIRWHHPKRGLVSPELFIPLAERHGLICSIGNWVIDDATRQAAMWREKGLRMRVAINISPYQMRQDDLVDRLQAALSRHKLQPSRFTCEITESVAMEDTSVTQRSFERLRQAGLHVSIDDFGVGQASLSYLRRLPAAELKIDASFVRDLASSADARSIVDAVVRLGHALGLKVVAEGVETEAQRDHLLRLDCDELQGFLFGKPMPAQALEAWALTEVAHAPASGAAGGFRESLFEETQPALL